jgi:hypothetical protein
MELTLFIFRTLVHRDIPVSQKGLPNFTIAISVINLAIIIGKCRAHAISIIDVVVVQIAVGIDVILVSIVVIEVRRRASPRRALLMVYP